MRRSGWLVKVKQVAQPLIVGQGNPIPKLTGKILHARCARISPLALKLTFDTRQIDHDRIVVVDRIVLRVMKTPRDVSVMVRVILRIVGRSNKTYILDDPKRLARQRTLKDRQDSAIVSSLDRAQRRAASDNTRWIERKFDQLNARRIRWGQLATPLVLKCSEPIAIKPMSELQADRVCIVDVFQKRVLIESTFLVAGASHGHLHDLAGHPLDRRVRVIGAYTHRLGPGPRGTRRDHPSHREQREERKHPEGHQQDQSLPWPSCHSISQVHRLLHVCFPLSRVVGSTMASL